MPKIKAVRWFAPRDMRLVEEERPVPGPHEVLVRVESVGVCGSDMHYLLDGRIGGNRLTTPTILGHEYAGIVEAAGVEADAALLGRRVAVEPGIPCMRCEWCRTGHYNVCEGMFFPGGPGCDGALREYMAVDARFCFPVPEGMTAPVAAMIEPAAVAVRMWMAPLPPVASIRPARVSVARCVDMVLCGTARCRAMPPAGSPSGSCSMRRRKTSSRVVWASAAKARMACSDSIYRD